MVKVLPGIDSGKYPYGNSVIVHGSDETVLIDPSLDMADAAHVDRIFISHCHEDHIAALHRFPHAAVSVHDADRIGLESLDGLMTIYGMSQAIEERWRIEVVDRFHYVARPDARSFGDGAVFDLGRTKIRVVHLPGHTRGHCGFFVEPDGVMFLADVDLTGFGPYYGDAWSSIDDFERSIERCKEIEAARYVTFHHKGIVNSRAELLRLLDDYRAVINKREAAILEFLEEPRTVDEMVAHRFVYRPGVMLIFTDAVERRSSELHLERLLARGMVTEVEPLKYRRVR